MPLPRFSITPGYRPSPREEYMNDRQQLYFRDKLLTLRRELLSRKEQFLCELKEKQMREADILDQSASHADTLVDFSTSQQQLRQLQEIDAALHRLEQGDYGYCEISGEEIGLKRLEAQPAARRSIEAQELFERRENMRGQDHCAMLAYFR